MQETRVRFLGWEVPLEKGMAIHSIIHAWKIPWTEKPGGLQSVGPQRVGHDWATYTHTHTLLLRTLHHPLCAPWMLCLVAQSCLTLWTVWPMDPLSSSVQMDSPGKKYWSRLPCPPPEDLLNPGIKPRSPTLPADSLWSELPGKLVDLVY